MVAICSAAVVCSCTEQAPASISDVIWALNDSDLNTTTIPINVAGGADSGWVVPSPEQAENGMLHVRFSLPNAAAGERYRYMVFYRNESYKFPESAPHGKQHPLAHENFYGGFPDGFHLSEMAGREGLTIDDVLSIHCDPRGEFPKDPWARNPRMGTYSLLIVAVPDGSLRDHPPVRGALDITLREQGQFIEPYWFWLHGPGRAQPGVSARVVPDAVRLHLTLDLKQGVMGCNNDRGQLVPFIHYIDPESRFDNVPVVADMSSSEYTPLKFDSMLCFTPKSRLIPTLPSVAVDPCTNMRYNELDSCIEIRNPAVMMDRPRKENVGIRSRAALTYGRFRVHCALAPLLNDSDLWNGLTNAIWLFGADAKGVSRRTCEGGYFTYAGDGGKAERRPTSVYAEIDFEIMKGMPLCPENAFPPIYPQQVADPSDRAAWVRTLPLEVRKESGNVAVACTNWDLACADPAGFGSGCQDVLFNGARFNAHRWDKDYRAVTEKRMEPDDALFGPAGYWFEIDWRPQEIIWRIGASLDSMRVVAYMNDSMTSIPEVPMWLVVSQEFHTTRWWPGAPYDQAGVPFPAKDLVGRIYSISVE